MFEIILWTVIIGNTVSKDYVNRFIDDDLIIIILLGTALGYAFARYPVDPVGPGGGCDLNPFNLDSAPTTISEISPAIVDASTNTRSIASDSSVSVPKFFDLLTKTGHDLEKVIIGVDSYITRDGVVLHMSKAVETPTGDSFSLALGELLMRASENPGMVESTAFINTINGAAAAKLTDDSINTWCSILQWTPGAM